MEDIKSNNPELTKYFEAVKEENYDESFEKVETWLRREHFFHSGKIQKTKSAKIKYFLFAQRAKLAYAVLTIFVTLIVANVKVTSKETVAGVISWSVNKNNKDAIEKIDRADWLDKNQLVVDNENGSDTNIIRYKFIIPDDSKLNPEQLKVKLEEIKDINTIQIIPITEAVNVPLYAAALHNVFKTDIPQKYVNAEDIRNNVYEQLKIAGIDNEDCDVNYTPDINGAKILIRIQQDSSKHKIHDDIMNSINTEKILINTEKMLNELKIQLNENLPKFKEEFGNYGKFNADKLNAEMERVQIKIDSMKFKFNEKEFERSMESLHKLDTLDKFINRKIEESMRLNEENLKKSEENLKRNDEKMKKFEEKMKDKEEKMREKEERLKSLDTLGKFISKQVEENLKINMGQLKSLDSLGPFLEKQLKITGNINFDTAKFNRKMERLKIKMDSLKFKWDGNKYDKDNENNDEENEEKEKEQDNSDSNNN